MMAARIFSTRNLLYLLYALVLLVTLAYIRFPSEKFKEFTERVIAEQFPGSKCSIAAMDYVFPAGVSFSNVVLTDLGEEQLQPLTINRLNLTSLLPRQWLSATIDGEIAGGSLSGRLQFDRASKAVSVKGVEAEGVPCATLVAVFAERKVSGVMRLNMEYQATWPFLLKGRGAGKVSLADGGIELLTPLFSLETLQFNELGFDFEIDDTRLKVSQGQSSGRDITAAFEGEFVIAEPLMASWIQLVGDLDFTPEFLIGHKREDILIQSVKSRFQTDTVPFKVGGVLNRPTISFEL